MDTSPARVLLEYAFDNSVNVLGLDDDGFITEKVLLGYTSIPAKAEAFATDAGWVQFDEWFVGECCVLRDLIPKPLIVTFVGSEILPDEELLRYAREANLPALSVESARLVPDEAKVLVTFSLEAPRGWSWE